MTSEEDIENEEVLNIKKKPKNKKKKRITKKKVSVTSSDSEKDKNTSFDFSTLKHSLSYSIDTEKSSKKNKTIDYKNDKENNNIDINHFIQHIPPWGGEFECETNGWINMLNTCTIDYFLLAIWLSCNISDKVKTSLLVSRLPFTCPLITITRLVDKLSWNEAKKLWLLNVCKFQFTVNRNKKKTISTFGTEYEFFISYLQEFQRYELNESCQNKKCRKSSTFLPTSLYFEKDEKNNTILNVHLNKICNKCEGNVDNKSNLLHNPGWLLVESGHKQHLKVCELPRSLSFNNQIYNLLCATFCNSSHFRAVFYLNNIYFLVDDLKHTEITDQIPNHKIVTSFYYLV